MKNIDAFKLTRNINVKQARECVVIKDENSKNNLISIINHRLTNRYLKHLNPKMLDSGFFKMAIVA